MKPLHVKGISPEIIEKDFWVCRTLRHIFLLENLPRIVLKGGTSLSKAFGIIKRFSEDIDLVINRHEIGFNDKNDPANQEQTNLRDRTIEALKATCVDVIEKEFLPKLKAEFQSIIGEQEWSLLLDPGAPDYDTIEFTYPNGTPDSLTPGSIKRVVRLELGCRGDQVPSKRL
jgi:Nucleotidyl transferase AbiEii toxin, Type IV TA system